MSEEEIKQLLQENKVLLEKVYQELHKQRRMRMWSIIITIVVIVVPLIAAVAALPWMMKTVQNYYGGALNI